MKTKTYELRDKIPLKRKTGKLSGYGTYYIEIASLESKNNIKINPYIKYSNILDKVLMLFPSNYYDSRKLSTGRKCITMESSDLRESIDIINSIHKQTLTYVNICDNLRDYIENNGMMIYF